MVQLKILMTTERFPPDVFGGGEYSAYFAAKTIAQNNEVHILTSMDSGKNDNIKFNEFEIPSNMHIHRIIKPSGGMLPEYIQNHEAYYVKSFRAINSFLKTQTGIDLIHSLSMNMVTGSVQACKKQKLPVIATVNDHWATCFFRNHYWDGQVCEVCSSDGLKECIKGNAGSIVSIPYVKQSMKIRKHFLKQCDGLIAISDKVKEILRANDFSQPIKTIPILVDTNLFGYEKPRYTKKVLFIGRIAPGKGVDIALKAFAAANIGKLIIVGTGMDLNKCKKLAHELGIGGKVEFKGNIDYTKIPELIHSSDIILAPFQRVEAFGRILVEANACGRGVITTDVGGGQMLIKDSENGFIFSVKDVKGMGKAIKKILSDKELVRNLGVSGRKRVEDILNPERISRQIESFYNKILDSKS